MKRNYTINTLLQRSDFDKKTKKIYNLIKNTFESKKKVAASFATEKYLHISFFIFAPDVKSLMLTFTRQDAVKHHEIRDLT